MLVACPFRHEVLPHKTCLLYELFLPQWRDGDSRIEEKMQCTNLVNERLQGIGIRSPRWFVLVLTLVVQKFRAHPRITSSANEGHQGIPLVRNQEAGIQVGVQTNDGGETKVRETSTTILIYEDVFL